MVIIRPEHLQAECRNYGQLLIELAKVVPDGVVCFFVSYLYMDRAVNAWHGMGVLDGIMANKLIFIETQVRPPSPPHLSCDES